MLRPFTMMATTLCLTSAVLAQDEDNRGSQVFFDVHSGYIQQTDEALSSGGKLEISRFMFNVGAQVVMNETTSLGLNFSYRHDEYEFNGVTGFGAGRPWEDVDTFGFGAMFQVDMQNNWTLFGGPTLKLARESGADTGDAWTFGGIIGASTEISNDFEAGFGIGVSSSIEDDVFVYPALYGDWQIMDGLRLTSRTRSLLGGIGAELIFDLGDGWEVGAGAAYHRSRFRLDNTGVAPNGVAEVDRVPIWVRLSYTIHPNATIDLYAGIASDTDITLEDSAGNRLFRDSYADEPMMLGVFANIRF